MRAVSFIVLYVLISVASPSHASDACSKLAIETTASVAVSDGSSLLTKTRFHSAEATSFEQSNGDTQTFIAIEGPNSWTKSGTQSVAGTEFHKAFALGHQFHAILLHFDKVADNIEATDSLLFRDVEHSALSGDYRYGGRVHLVFGAVESRPDGLLFEFPDSPPITVSFHDWRLEGEFEVPFELKIDDGQRIFVYTYSQVTITERSPLWFMEASGNVDLDEVNVYRLHRQLLAAHCLGDAPMMASLSSNEVLSADRGVLREIDRQDVQDRFSGVFRSIEYTEYHDTKLPVIGVSEDGKSAWIAAEVRPKGRVLETSEPFESQWAWIMLVEKVDGSWMHRGIASSARLQTTD